MCRVLTTILVTLLFCGSVWAAEEIAIVKQVKGKVNVKRSGAILIVALGDKLQSGDVLITAAASSIGMIFHDGSILTLGENSFLRIDDFLFKPVDKKFNLKLYLEKGSALFESGKIGVLAPEKFSFGIPEGTVGIRGTKFLVEVK